MNRELYVIIDTKVGDISGTILTLRNVNEAIRIFGDAIQNPSTIIHVHPDHHELHKIGTLVLNTKIERDTIPPRLEFHGMELINEMTLIITGEKLAAELEGTNA